MTAAPQEPQMQDKAQDTPDAIPLDAAQVEAVKRYDVRTMYLSGQPAQGTMLITSDGDYVLYSDYETLERQLSEALVEAENANNLATDLSLELLSKKDIIAATILRAEAAEALVAEIERVRSGNRYAQLERLALDRAEAAEAKLAKMQAEIARCHARLEIDHHFVLVDGEGLERRETPMEKRASQPDAISARDETIKLLDERIARFEAQAEPPASMDMFGDDEWRFSK